MTDPIETYLDELYSELRLTPQEARRLLREAEDHLRESQASLEGAGASSNDAAIEAVRRFGSVAHLLKLADREDPRGRMMRWLGAAIVSGLALVAIGFIAIGASGLVAWGLGGSFGEGYVAGDRGGVTYTPARCAELFRLEPGAADCSVAATEHHFFETVAYRLAAGVLGLVLAAAAWLLRPLGRRGPDLRGLAAAAGTLLFGAAGVFLAGQSIGFNGPDGDGAGAYLSGALVSLAVAGACAAAVTLWLRSNGRALAFALVRR